MSDRNTLAGWLHDVRKDQFVDKPKTKTVYVKPVNTRSERVEYFVGFQPSDASRDPCYQLGSYFIVCQTMDSARAIARSEADRINGNVVICDALTF